MTDSLLGRQPILLADTPHSAPGVNEHWCEHPGCRKWGGRGYAGGKSLTVWFCFEHCSAAEARPETAGGELA
jgi:hypothetical protein